MKLAMFICALTSSLMSLDSSSCPWSTIDARFDIYLSIETFANLDNQLGVPDLLSSW